METYERVKLLRKEHLKLSQEEFAQKLGTTRSVIKNIELNALKRPEQKEPLYKLICREFNVNYFWLTEGIGNDPFVGLPESALDEIVEEYKLDDLDKQLIIEYLNLKPDARSVIKEYIKNVFKKM